MAVTSKPHMVGKPHMCVYMLVFHSLLYTPVSHSFHYMLVSTSLHSHRIHYMFVTCLCFIASTTCPSLMFKVRVVALKPQLGRNATLLFVLGIALCMQICINHDQISTFFISSACHKMVEMLLNNKMLNYNVQFLELVSREKHQD